MDAQSIEHVAVLGLGTMGHGIAQTFALAGIKVGCFDEFETARANLTDRIRKNLEQFVDADLIERDAVEPCLGRLRVAKTQDEALSGAQFVVEAVREDLPTKQELFPRVEQVVADDTILVSNTSTFPMTQIAVNMRRPERALDTHWFNPPHICPLVEIVPGERTSKEAADTAFDLMERIGKLPVRVNKELPGFLVNRIQVAMNREVLNLMELGVASPEDIDRAVRASMGMRLAAFGPLQVWDFAGLDVCASVFQHLVQDIRSDRQLPDAIARLVADGHFGFKTGRGIYEHDEKSSAETLAQRDQSYLKLIKLFYRDA